MDCPICKIPLALAEKQGIEIDYCPKCRGIWLDRGELEKIMERSAPSNPSYQSGAYYPEDPHYRHNDHHDDHHEDHHDDHHYRGFGRQGQGKRRGFLGDLFDF